MAQEDKRSDTGDDSFGDAPSDETTQLKKRARRRLIGAVVLALMAAIMLPMVMDHQPAPPLKDIQVRIPSPDEGVMQRVSPKQIAPRKDERPVVAESIPKEATATLPDKSLARLEQKPLPVTEAKSEPKPEPKPELEPKPESRPEPKIEAKPESKPQSKPEQKVEATTGKAGAEAWEVQLGAYQESGRVKLLMGKLKELGIPSYTENVDTPAGARTRVRAGPFPSQELAEKARSRIKIIGVDGPVARKP